MTSALFVTTATSEPRDNVRAWAKWMGPAEHVTFDIDGPPRDLQIGVRALTTRPDVILYTGGVEGTGLPSDKALLYLRKLAPTIISQGDFTDPPWHEKLAHYRSIGAFDLYVSMDGGGPVDHTTLTPIDIDAFEPTGAERDIPCGFAGNHVPRERWSHVRKLHGTEDVRSAILHRLAPLVTLRERELQGDYRNFARWLQRCRMVINTSWAGSGTVHHMKGRVLETAFAGAALLEPADSPIARWFPEGSWFRYGSLDEAKAIIQHTPLDDVQARAVALSAYAREHYHPRQIFAGMVQALRERKAA